MPYVARSWWVPCGSKPPAHLSPGPARVKSWARVSQSQVFWRSCGILSVGDTDNARAWSCGVGCSKSCTTSILSSWVDHMTAIGRQEGKAGMEFARLGNSDLEVSRVCLGTMTFGEGNSFEEAYCQLSMARDAGVNFFDTAEMYPVPQQADTQGRSERFLGRWLKAARIPREKVVIATKVAGPSGQMTWIRGGPTAVDAANVAEAIDGSLTRLGIDHIDLYQIHWPDRYVPMFGDVEYVPAQQYKAVPLEEQLEALARAVEAGKVRYVGLSNETPWGLMRCCQIASNQPQLPQVVSIQNAYSLLCRTFDASLAECCHLEHVSLLAYSPLAMGILTGKYHSVKYAQAADSEARLHKYRGRYAEAEGRYPLDNERVKGAVIAYVALADKLGMTPLALALGFVLSNPLVASAVVGASSARQLSEILEAAEIRLGPEILAEINSIHEKYPNPTP